MKLPILLLLGFIYLIPLNSWSQTTVTYYFDSRNSPNNQWDSGEDNLVNGNTTNYAADNNNGHYIHMNTNTCPGTDLGAITKVELRAYFENNYDVNASRTIAPRLIPYFSGTQGSNYDYPNGDYDGGGFPAWGSYFDVTLDANAPATWDWTDVQNLDCRLVSNRPNSGQHKCYKVEIQITYSNCSSSAYRWTGAVNTDWGNVGNWCGSAVPTSSHNVIVPNGVTNWPTLNVDANCKNLTIESGAQLSCSSYDLNIYGNWDNSGSFYPNTGSVYFKGNSNSTLTISGTSQTILNEGFETGTSNWTLGALAGHAEWRRQSGAANTGTWDCALYDVANSSAHDFPRSGDNGYIDLSRNVDLSNYATASITYNWRSNADDQSHPLLSFDGTVLNDAMKSGGSSWHSETYSLNSFCGNYDNYLFFRMWVGAAVGGGAPGLCIDDIVITGVANVQNFYNIYFEKTGGATVTLNSSINTLNNIQISSGTLDADGYNLTVAKNFTNNGAFTSGNGIVKFNGVSTQNISGSSNTSFHDFIKDSSHDLILNGSSSVITVSNSFNWIDNDDNITINGTTMSFVINDKVLVSMGCELEINGGSTISVAKNFQNLGTVDFTTGNSILKFYSGNDSYILTEPGDTIFSDNFETDPFAGSSNWSITNPGGRSEYRWSNGQQHSGAKDLAVWDNMDGGYPYDYQWGTGTDSCLAEIDIDLTNYTGAILEFWWKCGGDDPTQAGYDGDYGQVFINDVPITGTLWGKQNYIKHAPISLANYCGGIVTLKFKFRQDGTWSGGHASSPGLCIDDILVYANCIETLDLHDLVVNKSNNSTSAILLCPLKANDDILVSKGILDSGGNNISLDGNWTNAPSSKFLARRDTVTFSGSTSKAIAIGSASFANLFVNKPSATLNISTNTLDIDSALVIYANSTLKSNGQDIEVGTDWVNNGTFTHNNNTVKFDNNSKIYSNGTNLGKSFYNLILDGTNAELEGDILIGNDFTITAGTWDVSSSNYEMTVYGNWLSNGTFEEQNGNVFIRGANTNVSFSGSDGFYNLTLSKALSASLLTCLTDFDVTNNLTMSIGQIDLRDQSIDLGTTGNLVNETNNSRIFASDGSGSPGEGTGTITATRTNPTGNVAGLGCEITPSSAMGVTTIARGHLLYTDIDGAGRGSITRYFDISPTNNSGLNATFIFHYFDNELQGQPEADLEQWRSTDAGSTWTNRNGIVNTGGDFVTLTAIDAFSKWTLSGKEIPLPIELLEFKANCDADVIELGWVTASEKNNEYFTIEKSIDGIFFEEIGYVDGKGNSNKVQEYSYEDYNQDNGAIYYRLKQTDFDNNYTRSEIIKTECRSGLLTTKDLTVFPNPVRQGNGVFIEVKGFNAEAEILVVVLDVYGRMQYSKVIVTLESKSTVIANDKLNRLPAGTYIIIGTSNDEIYRKKLIIN